MLSSINTNVEKTIVKNKENKENEENDKNNNDLNKNKIKDNEWDDMENKTVDEIYRYINDDKIVKSKKKKKSKKNKKHKKEEIMVEEKEDIIVNQFKEDMIDKLIHAGSITKIRPVFSESWIKIISEYD